MCFQNKIKKEFSAPDGRVSLNQIVSQQNDFLTIQQVELISDEIRSSQSLKSISLCDRKNIISTHIPILRPLQITPNSNKIMIQILKNRIFVNFL